MSGIIKSGMQVAFWTGLSKVFGLLRELFIAATFGSGALADSVNVMLRLPNFFRRILSEGAVASVFIPLFNEKMASSKAEAEKFTNQVFFFLLLLVCLLVLFFEVAMPVIVRMMVPGFASIPNQISKTSSLCRVAMPYLVLVTSVGFFSNILNAFSRFFASAFNPIILSSGVILATAIPIPIEKKPLAVAIALLIAGLIQLTFIMWHLCKVAIKVPKAPSRIDLLTIGPFLSKLIPAGIASSALQMQMLISQSLASFFEGSISILSYAERLYQLPLSILGVAFGTVMLQTLSKTKAGGASSQISDMQNKCLKVIWILAIPCTVGIIVLAEPIVQIVYQHGNFDGLNAKKVASALQLFSFGLPAIILTKILSNSFYVHHDTKSLLRITLWGLALNSALNIILMRFVGYLGIPLGSSIAAWAQLYMLFKSAFKKQYFLPSFATFKDMFGTMCVGLFMGLLLHFASNHCFSLLFAKALIGKIVLIAILAFLSTCVYFTGLVMTGKITFKKGLVTIYEDKDLP